MTIDTRDMGFAQLNRQIREGGQDCHLKNCIGQRFIAAGVSGKRLTIDGVPGNALGAYLNGAEITVNGNAQDAVGDTMNEGRIVINGNIGDAAGYAMRGGKIFIKGNAGYRAGIHMKAYKEKKPVMVIGGRAGSFLGEYQAGGIIIVLGLNDDQKPIVGNFPCTGMHGGKMFLRTDGEGISFPEQVSVDTATEGELEEIRPIIEDFCGCFGIDPKEILNSRFIAVTPDSKNPYKQMYVPN